MTVPGHTPAPEDSPLRTVPDAPSTADARPTVSSRELERLTGVSAERVRTWERRHGFPELLLDNGHRRYFAADVPRVLAVSQLIAAGHRVDDAVARVVAGDYDALGGRAALEAALGALPASAVALSGPEPLRVVWANEAARTAESGEIVGELRAPDHGSVAYRALQRLLVGDSEAAHLVTHPSWTDPESEPRRAIAWTVGPPEFVPAVIVLLDLPDDAEPEGDLDTEPVDEEPTTLDIERQWATAVGHARRVMQRGVGRVGIDATADALVTGTDALDGFVVLVQGEQLRTGMSVRGRFHAAMVDRDRDDLRLATVTRRAVWLSTETSADFSVPDGRQCLALPLLAGGHDYGYLMLEFE